MRHTRFVSLKTLADHLDVCTNTVRSMVERGELPKPIRLRQRILRWDLEAVDRSVLAREPDTVDPDDIIAGAGHG